MNKRKHSSGRIVFLLDVDNTLLDNDGVQADLRARNLLGSKPDIDATSHLEIG